VLAQPAHHGAPLIEVVFEHGVDGDGSGAEHGLQGVAVTVRSAQQSFVDTREFLGWSSSRVSRTLPSARSTVQRSRVVVPSWGLSPCVSNTVGRRTTSSTIVSSSS
jgi:hypothetical protein